MSYLPISRSRREIQRAHDVLGIVVHHADRLPSLDTEAVDTLLAMHTALCWALGHSNGWKMQANLAMLERDLAAAGLRLTPKTIRRADEPDN